MIDYPPPSRTRILLAVTPDLEERFRRILVRHELTSALDAAEVLRQLDGRFGMVILGVHFDDSQMFSLLGDIRTHSGYRKIPILCVLGVQRGRVLGEIAIEGLDHAVKALRANGFLDLLHFDDDEQGNARIARIVDYLILIDGDLQHIARTTGEDLVSFERRRAR
jgi:hypothetical protein